MKIMPNKYEMILEKILNKKGEPSQKINKKVKRK